MTRELNVTKQYVCADILMNLMTGHALLCQVSLTNSRYNHAVIFFYFEIHRSKCDM